MLRSVAANVETHEASNRLARSLHLSDPSQASSTEVVWCLQSRATPLTESPFAASPLRQPSFLYSGGEIVNDRGIVARLEDGHVAIVHRLHIELARNRFEVPPPQGDTPAHNVSIPQLHEIWLAVRSIAYRSQGSLNASGLWFTTLQGE